MVNSVDEVNECVEPKRESLVDRLTTAEKVFLANPGEDITAEYYLKATLFSLAVDGYLKVDDAGNLVRADKRMSNHFAHYEEACLRSMRAQDYDSLSRIFEGLDVRQHLAWNEYFAERNLDISLPGVIKLEMRKSFAITSKGEQAREELDEKAQKIVYAMMHGSLTDKLARDTHIILDDDPVGPDDFDQPEYKRIAEAVEKCIDQVYTS